MVVSYMSVQFILLFVDLIASVAGVDNRHRVVGQHQMLVPIVIAGKHFRALRAFVPKPTACMNPLLVVAFLC